MSDANTNPTKASSGGLRLIVICLLVVACMATAYLMVNDKAENIGISDGTLNTSSEDKVALIRESVEGIRQYTKLPMEIDPYTTWTNIDMNEEEHRVVYRYTIKGMTPELAQKAQPGIYNNVRTLMCSYPDVKALLAAGAGYRWRYFDENDNFIMEFDLIHGGCSG